jgi:hypothetical protein
MLVCMLMLLKKEIFLQSWIFVFIHETSISVPKEEDRVVDGNATTLGEFSRPSRSN